MMVGGNRLKRKLTPAPPAPHPTPITKRGDKVDKGKTFNYSLAVCLFACFLIQELVGRQLVATFPWPLWVVIFPSIPIFLIPRRQEQLEVLAGYSELFIYKMK